MRNVVIILLPDNLSREMVGRLVRNRLDMIAGFSFGELTDPGQSDPLAASAEAMNASAIYRRPNTSKPAPTGPAEGSGGYRVDQVWAADITYIPTGLPVPPSWTGIAGTYWPGNSPTPWTPASVWRRWRQF